MAHLMPLPLSEIQIGFTFLVLAHLGSPGKRALNGCSFVCSFTHYIVDLLLFSLNLMENL